MGVVLAINVKNEAEVVGRCLRSAAPFVDFVIACDTGSEDNTPRVIEDTCAALDLPFEVHTGCPWLGFASNQNILFDLARREGDYVWIIEADHIVHVGQTFSFPELTAPGYRLCRIEGGDWENWFPCLFRSSEDWVYHGERHAVPRCGTEPIKLHGIDVLHKRDGASGKLTKEQQRARFARDAEHFLELVSKDADDARAWYYLAQSNHDATNWEAALSAYRVRAVMPGGFGEERYIAQLQVARYLRWFYHPAEEVEAAFIAAHELRPWRHEAMCSLIKWWTARGDSRADAMIAKHQATPASNDRFLVQRSAYQWRPGMPLP